MTPTEIAANILQGEKNGFNSLTDYIAASQATIQRLENEIEELKILNDDKS